MQSHRTERETSPLNHRVNLSRKLTELYCAERQGVQKPERELFMLRVTRQFLSIHGYASVVYFTAIMHCSSEDTHLFGPLCYTSSLSHAHEMLNVSSGDTHTQTTYITYITWPFTFQTCHQTLCHPPRCVSCWDLCQPWLTGWQGDAVMIHAWAGGLTAGYLQHHTWVPRLPATPAKPSTDETERRASLT